MKHHTDETIKPDGPLFTIGQGIGPIGRWLRLFLGVYFLIFLVVNPLYLHPISAKALVGLAITVSGYFLLIAAAHFVVFMLISKPILSKLNPWAGTAIFVGIPTVPALLGLYPQTVQMAFGFYIGISLVLLFFMRYGGCEVVAIPSLLLKQRFPLYCPYNAIDAIERAMTPDKEWSHQRLLTILSMGIIILIGGYFILVEYNDLLGQYGIAIHIDNRWSLLLLIPCAQLAAFALKHYQAERSLFAPKVRKYALGAAILALTIVSFLFQGIGISGDVVWVALMGFGALYVLFQIGAQIISRLRSRHSPPLKAQ